MRLHAGEIVANRYEIDATIGSGGMSVVYRAYDLKLDRPVTLKVLKDDYLADVDLVERFPLEARAAAAIGHTNIVSIYDFGQDEDICYIVLEYVDGASLKDYINKRAPFEDIIIIDIAIQVASGLAAAHRQGIVHRDIKPQNILVTKNATIKVADFGIARVANSSTLPAGAGSMGSVHYSSPEQARNGYLDHTTDIYSLGVCMYEMATGRLPFDGETDVSVAMCHLNETFPDILDYNDMVSDSLLRIISKATEKSSSLRYQSAEDLIEDLKRAKIDETGDFVKEEVHDAPYSPPPQDPAKLAMDVRYRSREDFLNDRATELAQDDFDDIDNVEPESSDKAYLWGGAIMALFFVAILAVLFAFIIWPRLSGSTDRIFAPDIIGLSLEDAEALAAERGLYIYVHGYEYSDDIEEGSIISQVQSLTSAGLSAGDQVLVIVSQGPEIVYVYTMINHVGASVADVQSQLNMLDLTLVIEEVFDGNSDAGTVISQIPPADTRLRAGEQVTIFVSRGPDTGMVDIPNLIGLTDVAALELLSSVMLIPGIITQEESSYPSGTIIYQEPAAGESVYRESIVNYTISTGPAQVEPPPVPPAQPDPPPAQPETPPVEPDPPPQEPEPEPDTPEEEDPPPTDTPPDTTTDNDDLPDITLPPPPGVSSFTLLPWDVPEGTETVRIQIRSIIGDNAPQTLQDTNVSIGQLPQTFSVSGTGTITYQVFSIDDNGVEVMRGSFTINFDED